MPDISDLMKFADSTPEDAAQHIERSSILGIEPKAYKEMKDTLNAEYDKRKLPSQATEHVTKYMQQSEEHTALAAPDAEHLSYIERQAKLISDYVFDRPTVERRVIDLANKKMNSPDEFTADDDLELYNLNGERQELARRNYGLDGPVEPKPRDMFDMSTGFDELAGMAGTIPAKLAGAVGDMARGMFRQKEIIGGATATGAAVGAGVGAALSGGPGAVPGAIAGGAKGFTAGLVLGNAVDTYQSMTGSTYNELSTMTKEDGSPANIDESTKKDVARGVGLVSAGIAGGLGYALAKTTPFLAKYLSPMAARQIVLDPTNAAIKATIMNIGKAAGSGVIAGGLTEVTRILGEEMGHTYDGTEASFLNALSNASTKLNEYAPRVAEAAGINALAAGAIATATGVTGYKATKAGFERAQETAVAGARDVTPEAPLMLGEQPGVAPESKRPLTMLPGGGERPTLQAVKVLQLREAMSNINDAARQTKMAEVSPSELNSVKKMIFDGVGLKRVWLAVDDVRDFVSDPKRANAMRRLMMSAAGTDLGLIDFIRGFDKRNSAETKESAHKTVASSDTNAPIKVAPHAFMELVREFPDALDLMRIDPEGPSPRQAEKFLGELDSAEQKRKEIFTKLGIPNSVKVEEPSKVIDLPENTKTAKPTPEDTEALVRRAGEIQEKLSQEGTDLEAPASKELQSELDQIKTRVQAAYAMKEPGDLIIADWSEDGDKMALKAEEDYLNRPTFTPEMEKVLPATQVKKFNEAQLAARKQVHEAIQEAASLEQLKVQDAEIEFHKELAAQEEADRIANDPRFAVVDRFLRDQIADESGKNKRSLYVIDPKMLTKEQLHYVDAPLAKEHKLFKRGGMSPDEAARELGLTNGEELLKIMTTFPRRETVIEARSTHGTNWQFVEAQVRANVEKNYNKIIESYRNLIQNNVDELNFMLNHKWPSEKFGFKTMALPIPRLVKEYTQKAEAAVMKMKLEDLSLGQFRQAELKSQRLTIDHILKNEVYEAAVQKSKTALAIAMQKETLLAINRTNKALKLFRKFNDRSVMQELKDAGSGFEKAANEILDVFNLNPSRAGMSERDSYIEFARERLKNGDGDLSIPERLADVRQDVNELTVEQVEVLADRLGQILHLAKYKNRLLAKYEKLAAQEAAALALQTEEAIAEAYHEHSIQHPDYNEKNIPAVQGNYTAGQILGSVVNAAETLINNAEHIATYLDREVLGGLAHDLFIKKMKGDGEFDGKMGESGKRKDLAEFVQHFGKMIEAYDGEESATKLKFSDLNKSWVTIPEFADLPKFNNGNMVKGELLMIAAHMGDPDGRENLVKMGADLETIRKVLERELEMRDIKFVQNIVNLLGSYGERSVALQKTTTGQDVQLVEGVPWTFKGKQVTGGYWPQAYVTDFSKLNIDAAVKATKEQGAAILGKTEGDVYARQHAAEMTRQGRLISRVGSDPDASLDLSMFRFVRSAEEVLHDLNYRIPVRDTLKLLRNDSIRKDVMAVAGKEKYNLLVNSVIEMANRITADNNNYFNDQNRLMKVVFGNMQSGFAAAVLGFSVKSVVIQAASVAALPLRMGGASGTKYLTKTARTMLANPHLMSGYYDLAVEINPSIAAFMNDLEDSTASTIHNLLPSKSWSKTTAGITKKTKVDLLARGKEKLVDASLVGMGYMDQVIKVWGSVAAYSQFLAGEAPGTTLKQIQAMTPEERHTKAVDYARQISRLVLTHSMVDDKAPFQKLVVSSFFSKFFNDGRNLINNINAKGRQIKWDTKDTYRKTREGDYAGARGSASGAAGHILTLVITMTVMRVMIDEIRGFKQTPIDKKYKLDTPEGIADAAKYMTSYMLESPWDQYGDVIPFFKDVKFSAEREDRRSDQKNVQFPITKMYSDMATTYKAVAELLHGDRYKMSPDQTKAMLNSLSYISGGFPVKGVVELQKFYEKQQMAARRQFRLEQRDSATAELRQEIREYKLDPPKEMTAEFNKALDHLEKQITPELPAVEQIPKDAYAVMKSIQSGGNWTKVDSKTGAAGIYQFTQKEWTDIMGQAPDLGLTENGRVAKSPEQQERAMKWLTERNAQVLAAKELPVDAETLYAAKVLGLEKAVKLYQDAGDTKIKDLPPAFENMKTVGQVRKHIKALVKDKRLTLTADNEQD